MARYNTLVPTNIYATAGGNLTLTTPLQGVLTELTGAGSITVYLPNPVSYPGITQTFYNACGASVTLSSPSGNILGNGNSTATYTLNAGLSGTLYSDGTNWICVGFNGGAGSFTTISASGAVTLSPSNASVTISPSGTGSVTISPAVTGSISNVTGSFTTLAASSTVSGTGFSSYLSSPPAIGNVAANTGAFTTLSASSTVSGTGFSSYLASPPAIGGTAPAAGSFTSLSASGSVSGTGFSNYLASPPAIGSTTAAAGSFTTLSCTSITETSSIAFKENITPIGNPLDAIAQLVGVKYDRKDGSQKNEPGLIAEDVYKVLPELVHLQDGKPFGIHYSKITAYLVEAVKALQAEINELKGTK